MMLVKALVVCACLALVWAGAPTVDESFTLFPQNGGRIAVTGSGFTRGNPASQFNWILRNANGVWMSNPGLRGVGGALSWTGCVPRTLEVNAGGNTIGCTIEYIPDYVIEAAGAGTTTLELDVVNSNGFLLQGDNTGNSGRTIAVIENVDERLFFSFTNTVPQLLHGISVTGEGFPAFDSIFYEPGAQTLFSLELEFGGASPHVIDVGQNVPNFESKFGNSALFDLGLGTSGVNPAVTIGPGTSVIGTANAGTTPNGDFRCECTHDRSRVDCGFCTSALTGGGMDVSLATLTPTGGLFATLFVTSFEDHTGSTIERDQIGMAQIAIVDENLRVVTVDESATVYDWNADEIRITGSGFAKFPSIQSNVVIFVDDTATNNPSPDPASQIEWRCDPLDAPGMYANELVCKPSTLPPTGGGLVPIKVVVVVGDGFSFGLNAMTGAISHTVGFIDLGDVVVAADGLDPQSGPLQADSRTLELRSTDLQFAVNERVDFLSTNTDTDSANEPNRIVTTVELNGLESGTTTCRSQAPYSDVIVDSGGSPACVIKSTTRGSIVLDIPPITTPIGTSVSAVVTTQFLDASGAVVDTLVQGLGAGSIPQVVSVISPGAGVGGDPHFFGFLGEKYDFKGEPGAIYNILSDEDVQLNAVIGQWRYSRGEETIIRKLALKTRSHQIVIDAGGNAIDSVGFSILVDGKAIAPHKSNTTLLGRDGTVRWNAVTPDDHFHLPLWERHNGVAVVEIILRNYRFEVLAVEEGRNSQGEWHHHPSRYLDFMCQMFDETRHPHGLFGQSAHLPSGKRSISDWSLEGEADDYKVTHEFADDFTFNQFQY